MVHFPSVHCAWSGAMSAMPRGVAVETCCKRRPACCSTAMRPLPLPAGETHRHSTPFAHVPECFSPECMQEIVNGQLKKKYGDCFIRGNNVLYICTAKS